MFGRIPPMNPAVPLFEALLNGRRESNMDDTILKLINEKTIGTIDDKALYQIFVDMNGSYYKDNDSTVSVYSYRDKCFVTIRKSSFLAKMGSHSYQRQLLESFILHEANLLRGGGETNENDKRYGQVK